MTCCSFTLTRCRALLDKVAGTLALPPTMHLDQLIKIDSPESVLSRLSEQADVMVLGHDHPALGGHLPFGHPTSTVASMSRHPVVAVPRGWTQPADDRRPITVAIDGKHPSSSTLGYAFTEVSLRHVPLLVVHAAPLAELASGDQDTRLNLAEIHAGWKADYPDISVETFCYPVVRSTRSPRCRMTCSCWSLGVPTPAGNGHAGSVPSHAPHLIGPPGRSPSFRISTRVRPPRTRAWRAWSVSIRRCSSCGLRPGLGGSASAFPRAA
jgi:hypothetical protein